METNFSKLKINCCSLPVLMTTSNTSRPLSDSQEAEFIKLNSKEKDKLTVNQEEKLEAFIKRKENLLKGDAFSTTATSELKNIYALAKYGKAPVSISKDYSTPILNGIMSEHESLKLFSELDGIDYKRHKKTISNSYIKGQIDAFVGKSVKKCSKVIEIKTAANMQSLVTSIGYEELLRKYKWQLAGYLYLTGAEVGEIIHCVVTYPEKIINEEIKKFKFKAVNWGMPIEYIEREIEKIRFNLTFDDIPAEERVIRVRLERNEEDILMIKNKVKATRKWLSDFELLHLSHINI